MTNRTFFSRLAKRDNRRPRQLHNHSLHLELLEGRLLLAGNPLFRINAGGTSLAGTPGWSADTAASPSPYVNSATGNSTAATTTASVDLSHASVPAGTPMAVFQSERFDKAGGANMLWDFPVTPGQHEVRLYFAETWSGAQATGIRQFDVQIEGNTVLDNYDVFADVGGFKGVVKSFTVTSDANLDIDFLRVIQNPSIKGIEILEPAPGTSTLLTSTTSLDFNSVVINSSSTHVVTLTNGGSVGSSDITINPSQASISPVGTPYTFEFADTVPIVLSPGASTDVAVTYTPTAAGTNNATLSIPHSAPNSPISVSLTGSGVASLPVSFTKSTLQGAVMDRPTKVQFGPDGRLYVSQQNGLIRIFNVVKNGPNNYQATQSEQLTIIKNIPNHNDDGTLNTIESQRLVTGMLVTGTAQNPVIYVSSSDPRIGAGTSHEDLNLDTNSGIISRVTWNGFSWLKLDLVRGLPRSEENHGTNGLQLDATTNTLYVAVGGNTNMGGPSQNFSFLPEYALSAAILSIDLDAIGNTTYDLPTLNDEDRAGVNDLNDPFGGNDGKNQAIIVPGGPVQVYSPGYRNPYDLHITAAGRLYVTDNGSNAGWGGMPVGEGPGGNATNDPVTSPGITIEDQLHYVPGPGFYGGHPNPTRANLTNTFNVTNPQSPVALVGPHAAESNYLLPVTEDGAIYSNLASTNGIDEYTSTTFGGQLQGDLITASFDNTVKRIKLNAAGTAVTFSQNLFSNVGVRPLDVDCVDNGPLAGNILVADIGMDCVFVYEPSEAPGNPNDFDGDGYSNADEEANDTDPNNAGDVPPDFDLDFVSDLIDTDDDNDSLLDNSDRFAVDSHNGNTTPVGTLYDWENEGADDGGLLDLGFSGLMSNGVDDYLTLFDPEAVTAGGAAGVFTIDSATAGTARGATNTQEQAFQFGFKVAGETLPFTAKSSIAAPFSGLTPQAGQEMGMFIGTGDQDNYVQIVLAGANGGSIQLMKEVGGVFTTVASENLTLPGTGFVDFFLLIDPVAHTLQASYSIDAAAPVNLGSSLAIPTAWLASSLAVGVISTNPFAAPLPVTWDFLGVESAPSLGDPEAFLLIQPPSGGLLTSSVYPSGSFRLTNNSTGNVRIQSVTIDTSTALLPDLVFDPLGQAGNDTGKPFTPDSGATETGLLGHEHFGPHDGGFDVLKINFIEFDPGETLVFSLDVEPTSIKGSEPPGPSFSGHVSGLELAGSTVTVVFSNGTTTQTQTFRTLGIAKASQTTARSNLPLAPGLSLVGTTTPPAAVINPNQTLRVNGPAGSSVRLLQVEAALSLTGVPNGGFDIDPFEVNKVIKLAEHFVTIGAGGFVNVPVTLTKTDPEGGYNYFIATIQDAAGRTGAVSQKVILKLQDSISNSAVKVSIVPNGTLNNSSTTTASSFQVINQSTTGENITSITFNLSGALLPDIVFDPNGNAGDVSGKVFTANSGAAETGQSSHAFNGSHDGGFDSLTVNFSEFNPGETFTFSIDVDPTSVKGSVQPGPKQSSSISGLEASGAAITVLFSDSTIRTGEVFAVNGSRVNSQQILNNAIIATPSIAMIGVSSTPTIVTNASQTIRITGPAGATARLLQTENARYLGGVPGGGFDIDQFETNKVIFVKHTTVTVGASGFVDVPIVLNDSAPEGGVNHFMAVIEGLNGQTSEVSNQLVVALNDLPGTSAALAGDYDFSGTVDTADNTVWKSAYGSEGSNLYGDGNSDGAVDPSDYVIWRANLGASNDIPEQGGQSQFEAADSTAALASDDGRSLVVMPQALSKASGNDTESATRVASATWYSEAPESSSFEVMSRPVLVVQSSDTYSVLEQAYQELNLLTDDWPDPAEDDDGDSNSTYVENDIGDADIAAGASDAVFELVDDDLSLF